LDPFLLKGKETFQRGNSTSLKELKHFKEEKLFGKFNKTTK